MKTVMCRPVRVASAVCALALGAGPAAAHPHVWINAVVTFLFVRPTSSEHKARSPWSGGRC